MADSDNQIAFDMHAILLNLLEVLDQNTRISPSIRMDLPSCFKAISFRLISFFEQQSGLLQNRQQLGTTLVRLRLYNSRQLLTIEHMLLVCADFMSLSSEAHNYARSNFSGDVPLFC